MFYHPTNIVCLVVFALGLTGVAQAKQNPAAQALAGQLKPQGLTPKGDAGGLNKVRDQIIKILNGMEQSQVSNGPGAKELLTTAYRFYRPDVGPAQQAAAVGALTGMWSAARALGLFDETHKFTGKITQGADAGQACVFEYIVPMALAPAFSRDVTNVRIVGPSQKRAEKAGTTTNEQAYLVMLKAIEREVAGMKSIAAMENGPKTNAVGQTAEEAKKIWTEEMKNDGAAADELPSLILLGRVISSPSNRNGDKWVSQLEITNLSMHATEVEVECIFIGTTDKDRQNYVMGEPKKKLQLRSGEMQKVDFDTPLREGDYKNRTDDFEKLTKAERAKSRAYYRGTMWRVSHKKGLAGTFATNPSMMSLFDKDATIKLEMLPKLYLDPKTWPKYEP